MRTDLHEAAEANDLEKTRSLVRAGADTQESDSFRRTPLYCAILHSSKDVERYLRRIPVRSRDIYEAAENDHVYVIASFIQRGVPVDLEDRFERTPLHLAAHCNSERAAEFLVRQGANTSHRDKHGRTPLHKTATGDSHEVASILIGAGASVEVTNNKGHTPLHIAALKNSTRVADLLIRHGANVDSSSGLNLMTPLHKTAENDSVDVARLLLNSGSDMDLRTRCGMTFRDCAFRNNATQCLGLVMRRRKNIITS